jgi:enoyl-CoA hydratase
MTDTTAPAPGSAATEEPVVVRERHGRIELVRINRESARNSINGPTTKLMDAIMDELTEDPEVWVVVLTGTGDRAFCAGLDLKAFASGDTADIMGSKNGFAGLGSRKFPKPLIAAVNGAALAGGCEIVLSCDLVVAAEHAIFGIPEVKRGLVAAGGGLIRLEKLIPRNIALELALNGDSIDAARAKELGLVNRVVPAADVVAEALGLADKICENAPLAVRTSKEIMRRARDLTEEEAWKMNGQLTVPIFTSHDAMEGAVAFAERRPPVWQGA